MRFRRMLKGDYLSAAADGIVVALRDSRGHVGPREREKASEGREEAHDAIGIATAARWLLLQQPGLVPPAFRHDDPVGRFAAR